MSLDCSYQEITAKSIAEIEERLKADPNLKEANFNNLENFTASFQQLIPFLQQDKQLEIIYLDRNSFTAANLQQLADLIMMNKTLKAISCVGDKIDPKAFTPIITAARSSRNLIRLKFFESNDNKIQKEINKFYRRNMLLSKPSGFVKNDELIIKEAALDMDAINIAIKELGDHAVLKKIALNNCELNDECFGLLVEFLCNEHNKVQVVNLNANHLSNASLTHLNRLVTENKEITDISLCDNKFTEEVYREILKLIRKNYRLTNFVMTGNDTWRSGTDKLDELQWYVTAIMKRNKLLLNLDAELQQGNSIALTNVDLGLLDDLNIILKILINRSTLKRVEFIDCRLNDKCFAAIVEFLFGENNQVRSLKLDDNFFTDASLPGLQKLLAENKNIDEVSLCGNKYTKEGGDKIVRFVDNNYSLNKFLISTEAEQIDNYFYKLQIRLNRKIQRNVYLKEMAGQTLKSLNYSKLSGYEIDRILTKGLEQQHEIESISMKECVISDKSFIKIVEWILANTLLITLDLSNTMLTDASVPLIGKLIRQHQGLKKINLNKNKFTENGCEAIFQSVSENINLVKVTIDDGYRVIDDTPTTNAYQDKIDDLMDRNKHFVKVGETLADKTTHVLACQGKYLESFGLNFLLSSIVNNAHITNLNLQNCQLDDKCLEILANFFKANKTIEVLDISQNNFTLMGLKALLEALESNNTLIELKLALNKLDDEAAKLISKLITHKNCVLAYFDISNNRIAQNGMKHLAEGLAINQSLISLILDKNPVPGSAMKTLAEYLKKNKTLTQVSLLDSEIDANSVSQLLTVLYPDIQARKDKKNKKIDNTAITKLTISQKSGTNNKVFYSDAIYKMLAAYCSATKMRANALISAVEMGELDNVKKIAGENNAKKSGDEASIYVRNDGDEDTLLHIAAKSDNPKIIKIAEFLLNERKFNRNLRNKARKTPLDLAIANNNEAMIKLLTNAFNLSEPTPTKPITPAPSNQKQAKRKIVNQYNPNKDEVPDTLDTTIISKKPKTDIDPLVPTSMQIDESAAIDMSNTAADVVNPSLINKIYLAKNAETSLFDLVATGNVYQLKNIIDEELIKCKNTAGQTLLHIAVSAQQYSCAEFLLEQGADPNRSDTDGITVIILLIENILKQNNVPLIAAQLQLVLRLIKQNAQTQMLMSGESLGVEHLTLLHKVVAYGHYKLMKLLLMASDCDPNKLDAKRWTALNWAVDRNNIEMVDRLLIDRRMSSESIESAKQQATQKLKEQRAKGYHVPAIETIIQLLQKRQDVVVSPMISGIKSIKQFSVIYGSRYGKPEKAVYINSEKEHASLALQNAFSRQRLFNPEIEIKNEKAKVKDFPGNPVTASLCFIVSTQRYKYGENHARCKIRVNLDFVENYHVNGLEETEEALSAIAKNRIIKRVDAAPEDIFTSTRFQNPPCRSTEIEKAFETSFATDDPNYQLDFHHGEQALLNHLEQIETVKNIVNKLMQADKFIQGCKVYGIILDIHSPRYICKNCEVSLLGAQNSEQSVFLKLLNQQLKSIGCTLPQFSPIRMLIQASSYKPYPREDDNVTAKDHELLTVDMRTCQNLILAKDIAAFENSLTQYHSRKFEI